MLKKLSHFSSARLCFSKNHHKKNRSEKVVHSLVVELGFGQKFKPDPRVGQIRQPNPRVGQLEPEEIELVTYKFLELEQKLLSKPES
jgi:hypothetical protein